MHLVTWSGGNNGGRSMIELGVCGKDRTVGYDRIRSMWERQDGRIETYLFSFYCISRLY